MSDKRHEVLTAWGAQENPLVLAQYFRMGEYWMVHNDEFLSRGQGSYRKMITTGYGGGHGVRGYQGILVVVVGDRVQPPKHWDEVVEWINVTPGITTWTEVLP